jgi:hypothetical protein
VIEEQQCRRRAPIWLRQSPNAGLVPACVAGHNGRIGDAKGRYPR